MAFKQNGLSIGDIVILTKDMKVLSGTFEKGTRMEVIGHGERGYDFKDEEGNRLLETGLCENFYEDSK